MKKILGSVAVLSTLLFSSVSASFMYVEIDPVCSITGETYTNIAAGKSDTSSWAIPTAYEGECMNGAVLSDAVKENVYKISSDFFIKYSDENRVSDDGISLNSKGQTIVKNELFPRIAEIIALEVQKDTVDTKKIAVLNYFAKTIGYDYFVSKPYSG